MDRNDEPLDRSTERRIVGLASLLAFALVLLATLSLIATDQWRITHFPNPPAEELFYAPSKYERQHGPPDEVCKWWGGEWYASAEHTECVRRVKDNDGKEGQQ